MKKRLFQMTALLLGFAVITLSSCKKEEDDDNNNNGGNNTTVGSEVTIRDNGQGTGTVTWSADTTYILDGLVFVNEGQVLTIEPGTLVKAKSGEGVNSSALIVARGGKIMAEGTAEKPIVFTAVTDNYEGTVLGVYERGAWGGVIILGKAKLNSSPGTSQIEGIETTEVRGSYGGDQNTDNSGVLKYVSIRHGGTLIGANNEINGLTLGGVGSGTTLEYIEVVGNQDDGVEFFGGVPRLKNCVVAYCGDDCYDYDEGYDGLGQFWLAIQEPDGDGDRMGEHDGGTDPEVGEPYATPEIYNATYIGKDVDSSGGKRVITFRDNAGGHYVNSIFANQSKGIDVEVLESEQDSYKQLQDGNLVVKNCIFSDISAENMFTISYSSDDVSTELQAKVSEAETFFQGKFSEWNNTTATGLVSASNPIPSGDVSNVATPNDSWFESVSYQGAFDPSGTNWASGWTLTFKSK